MNSTLHYFTFFVEIFSFSLEIFQNVDLLFKIVFKFFTFTEISLSIGFGSCIVLELISNLQF
jgi:hypothetical protein